MSANTDNSSEFTDQFNWWYFLGIVVTLAAFPLLHILAWLGRIIFI